MIDLALELREALARPLPGRSYQESMLPAARVGQVSPADPRPSAVLVPIVADLGSHAILLIERAAGGPHGGQIAFPGGSEEEGDASAAETALREAREEIGLDRGEVEVLGPLSPLTIEVSGFLVQPVVGFARGVRGLSPSPGEVAAIHRVPLARLLDPSSKTEREIEARGERLLAPCYVFSEVLVWGATAMILAELEEVLRRAAQFRPGFHP